MPQGPTHSHLDRAVCLAEASCADDAVSSESTVLARGVGKENTRLEKVIQLSKGRRSQHTGGKGLSF